MISSSLYIALFLFITNVNGVWSAALERELKDTKLQARTSGSDSSNQETPPQTQAKGNQSATISSPMFDGLVLTDALFNYGDVDNDRHLTLEEINDFYRDIIGFRPDLAQRTAGNLIIIGDTNKNGVLEWEEIMSAIDLMKKEMASTMKKKKKF